MLTRDKYYELLLREGAKSDKSRAEYVRQMYGGGWHLSDEVILKEVTLKRERIVNKLLQYKNISWDEWGKIFDESNDLLYTSFGLTPPLRESNDPDTELEKMEKEIYKDPFLYPEDNEEEEEEEYYDSYHQFDGQGKIRKIKREIAEEREKMGFEKHAELTGIISELFDDFFLIDEETKRKLPCVNFI